MFSQKAPLIEKIVDGKVSTAANALLVEKYGSRLSTSVSRHENAYVLRRFLWTLSLTKIREITDRV